MTYFTLAPTIYATQCEDAIIILDSAKDAYISLVGGSATDLKNILENPLIGNEIDTNSAIDDFLEQGFIVRTNQATKTRLMPGPLEPGGLIDYKWDSKIGWKPFAYASKITVMQALWQLRKVHVAIDKTGFATLLTMIKAEHDPGKVYHMPTEQEIAKLSAAIDAASIVYPKKTFCLAWATTFVIMALRRGWMCNLVIGIQTQPFYAHAWAETTGRVIHDDPVISKVLAKILQEPFQE